MEQSSLFEFASPTDSEKEILPPDDEIKNILKLGWLSMFTSRTTKPSDRNKAGEDLAKLCGFFEVKKQLGVTVHDPKDLNDFYNEQ